MTVYDSGAERRIPGLALAQPASGELQNFRYAAPVLCGKPVLENCVMADDCDLAFEYSSVHATIDSPVRSVKNPRSGRIIAESYGEIILDKHIKAPADCALKPGTNGLVSPPDNFRTGRWERETTIPITFCRSSAKEKKMTLGQQLRLTAYLSAPAVMAQLSSIAMQYIDASMVGSLGANHRPPSGWYRPRRGCSGDCARPQQRGSPYRWRTGSGPATFAGARKVLRESVAATFIFGSLLAAVGVSIGGALPGWLGGDEAIRRFVRLLRIFSLFLPALQLNFLAGGMLRCSGNMRVPSLLNVLMCLLDVVFNFFLIFPTRQMEFWTSVSSYPVRAWAWKARHWERCSPNWHWRRDDVVSLPRSPLLLKLSGNRGFSCPERIRCAKPCHRPADRIRTRGHCGAQIMTTVIVAPARLRDSRQLVRHHSRKPLCYMPGYGIAEAATTLVGQSLG